MSLFPSSDGSQTSQVQRCELCRHFKAGTKYAKGICRFNPPVVVEFGSMLLTVWPEVSETNWCGKFNAEGGR